MKLHTWIVLGMVVGVSVGWILGPDSPALSGDVVLVSRNLSMFLHEEPDGAELPPLKRDLYGLVSSHEEGWTTLCFGEEGKAVFANDSDITAEQRTRGEISLDPEMETPLFRTPGDERIAAPDRDGRGRFVQSREGWVGLCAEGRSSPLYIRENRLPGQRYSRTGLGILGFLSLIGDIFLRLLKMLVVPLVIVSLTAGVASLGDPRKLGKMGAITLGYFFMTTAVAVTIGLTAAVLLRPGDAMPEAERERLTGPGDVAIDTADLPGFADRLREMVPENPLAALAEGDMLQVIFFAVMLGAALCLLAKEKADPMITLLEAATDAMVRMVHMVMLVAPIGVSAMMATVTARSGLAVMLSLAAYGGVVLLGLFLHVSLAYVPSVKFLAGVGIRRFFKAARPTQLLTFGTSSSSASLPVTMECAQKGLGISKHVSTFVIPVGSTVNMDGTALYQGVAAVFIAQLFNVELAPAQLLQIVAMATLASVGAAGVPGAGMVTLTMVLTSLGLGAEGVAIIMGLDRILDMFRSAVNVTGDLTCTAVVARFQGEKPGSAPFQEVDLKEVEQQAEKAADGDEEEGDES